MQYVPPLLCCIISTIFIFIAHSLTHSLNHSIHHNTTDEMLFVQLLATAALLPWTLAAPNVVPPINVVNHSVCLRACFIDQPFCPGDMVCICLLFCCLYPTHTSIRKKTQANISSQVPEHLGACWTCCLPTDTYTFPPEHGPNDQQYVFTLSYIKERANWYRYA